MTQPTDQNDYPLVQEKTPLDSLEGITDAAGLEKKIYSVGNRHYMMRGRDPGNMRDFDPLKIFTVIYKCIHATPEYKRDIDNVEGCRFYGEELSEQNLALRIYELVVAQLRGAFPELESPPTVEATQDAIVDSFTETGLITLAKAFQSYRGAKAANRFTSDGVQCLSDKCLADTLNHHGKTDDLRRTMLAFQRDELRCSTIAELNDHIKHKTLMDIIILQNNFYMQMMNDLAAELASDDEWKVCVYAGPSSSGKTGGSTKLVRLLVELGQATGYSEIDMYFWPAIHQKQTRKGAFNYEREISINLRRAGEHTRDMLNGFRVMQPKYDYIKHEVKYEPAHIPKGSRIVIDSHMGLDLNLTLPIIEEFGPSSVKRVYIENIHGFSDGEDIHAEDLRFLRRTVRDVTGRGHPPYATAQGWFNVEFNVHGGIRAKRESGDYFVTGALVHDLAVLKYAMDAGSVHLPKPEEFMCRGNQNPDAYVRLKRIQGLLDKVDIGDSKYMASVMAWLSPFDAAREFVGGVGLPDNMKKMDISLFPAKHMYRHGLML